MSVLQPRAITGLTDIAGDFDFFLIDQFGVLRDGRGPYPGAPDALQRLKAEGKHIVILSNSGKRSADNDRRLVKLGFSDDSWDLFLTSGEVAYRLMGEGGGLLPAGSRKCLLISRDGDLSPLSGLDLERTEDGGDADIVLIAGSEAERHDLAHYERLLAPAARHGVPCLCTNPDRHMLTASGLLFGAGRIAELYQQLGGTVRFIGKPFPDIYAQALASLGNPDKRRVVCVGDSVEHDIAGAAAAGLSSLLVATGILEGMDAGGREALYRNHRATPDFIMPRFVWQEPTP